MIAFGRNAIFVTSVQFVAFFIIINLLIMTKLLYKKDVYDIVGVCMNIYNVLGYGFLEIVYKDVMEIEFLENKILYIREMCIRDR